jgi:hypothetical protein
MINPPNEKRCSKCWKALDLKTALELEEKDREEKEMLDAEIKRQGQSIDYLLSELKRLKTNS